MADLFVLGDTDTVLGFAYVGVEGTVVESAPAAKQAFDAAVRRPDVKILIITEGVAHLVRADVDEVRFEGERPVIVEIPGPDGPRPDRRALLDLIRLAIGVRV